MTVYQLNDDQIQELKEKLWFDNCSLNEEEFLEYYGEDAPKDVKSAFYVDDIHDDTVYHFFDSIDFVVDDFCCTAGMYELEEFEEEELTA